jgi:hypothetical protein
MNELPRDAVQRLGRQDTGIMVDTIARNAPANLEGQANDSYLEDLRRFEESWREFCKQLFSKDSDKERSYRSAWRAAEKRLASINLDLLEAQFEAQSRATDSTATASAIDEAEMPYCVQYVQRPWLDYIRGAALAMDPFPDYSTCRAHSSEIAEMMSDGDAVRLDIAEAWGQMIEEDPRLGQLIAQTVGEKTSGGRTGAKRTYS